MKQPLSPLRIIFLFGLSLVLFFAGTAFGQVQATAAKPQDDPIQISADKMTAEEKSHTVVFTGNVDAKQGGVRIRSDQMTIYYIEDGKKKTDQKAQNSQQVKEIFCKGNVEVTSEEWLGTSDTMHYFSKKQLVQLIGNAKAYEGQNMVQGHRIDYHLDSGKSEIFGKKESAGSGKTPQKQNERVNMTILQQ